MDLPGRFYASQRLARTDYARPLPIAANAAVMRLLLIQRLRPGLRRRETRRLFASRVSSPGLENNFRREFSAPLDDFFRGAFSARASVPLVTKK